MTEQQAKEMCKVLIENNKNKPFSDEEKELFKQLVDKAKTKEELILLAVKYFSL